jgi:hypothetical protein
VLALEQGQHENNAPMPLSWFYGEAEPVQSSKAKPPGTLADFYRQIEELRPLAIMKKS